MTGKFATTYCSQCGREFGPGDHGFSNCENHLRRVPDITKTAQDMIADLFQVSLDFPGRPYFDHVRGELLRNAAETIANLCTEIIALRQALDQVAD